MTWQTITIQQPTPRGSVVIVGTNRDPVRFTAPYDLSVGDIVYLEGGRVLCVIREMVG